MTSIRTAYWLSSQRCEARCVSSRRSRTVGCNEGANERFLTTTAAPLPAVLADLDEAQREGVAMSEGPVLLIAGPGAGKTLTLVRRALHILTAGLARPNELVLCTFTEKAALELRDRLRSAAIEVGYTGDLSSLRTGTIHGVCNEFVDLYRHLTPLGNGYEVLDELTRVPRRCALVDAPASAAAGEERIDDREGRRLLLDWVATLEDGLGERSDHPVIDERAQALHGDAIGGERLLLRMGPRSDVDDLGGRHGFDDAACDADAAEVGVDNGDDPPAGTELREKVAGGGPELA